MAVQYPQAPGRHDEQSCAWEEDPNQPDGEVPLVSFKAGCDQVDQQGGDRYPDQDEDGHQEAQEAGNDLGHLVGLLFLVAGEQPCIDRYERGGQDPLTEEVLKEVGNPECRAKGVRCRGIAEVVGKHPVPDKPCQAAQDDAHPHQDGRSARTGRSLSCASSYGHGYSGQLRSTGSMGAIVGALRRVVHVPEKGNLRSQQGRKEVVPRMNANRREWLSPWAVGWACSRHRRTRRFASTGRRCLPGDLRRPPLGQASLPRRDLLARMRTAQSVCESLFDGWYRTGRVVSCQVRAAR